MWAGFIPDVRYVCNNGRAGAVAGRQPFPPVGAPAVNMGIQSGRGHSLSGSAAAYRSPLACNGPGARGVTLRHAAALCWESSDRGVVGAGCRHGGLQLRYARGPQSCSPVRQRLGTGESPSRWSGRYWPVRGSAPQDKGLDRRPGIPGVGGTRITPVGRLPPRLPGSSSRAWRCSPSSGAAPPP